MRKNAHKLKNNWHLCLKLFTVSCLLSCQTLFKQDLNSLDQAFVVQWTYESKSQKTSSITSYIYSRGDELLRVDFIVPFRGTVSRFVLNQDQLTLQFPLKKEFYKGKFNSKVFLPEFDSIPPRWFFAFLKGTPLENWVCHDFKNKKTCQMRDFSIQWIFNKRGWKQAYFMSSRNEKVKIKKIKRLYKKFPKNTFTLSLEGYKKQQQLSLE